MKHVSNAVIEADGEFLTAPADDAIVAFCDATVDFAAFFATASQARAACLTGTRERCRKAAGCTGYNERKF